MYGFGYDPEVPAGYQDADIEMAELREAAREMELEEQAAENERVALDNQASVMSLAPDEVWNGYMAECMELDRKIGALQDERARLEIQMREHNPQPTPQRIRCPKCGGEDLELMTLILVDEDWNTYDFVGGDGTGLPIFTHAKSVWCETSQHRAPMMECNMPRVEQTHPWDTCDEQWEVTWHDFDVE